MALESARRHQVRRQGQHDQGRRSTRPSKILIELKKAGHFRAFWTTFDQSVNLMASGEVVHPVDVVAGRDRRARARHRLLLRAAQGRLSRLGRRPRA